MNREEPIVAGEVYHVYNRGNRNQVVFREARDYLHALRKLRQAIERNGVELVAYCLMPNHYHLLARPLTDKGLSEAMRAWVTSVSKTANKKYGLVGHMFQDKFKAKRVASPDYVVHVARHIHLNPVAAGLAARAEDWPYSSYPDTVGLRAGNLPAVESLLWAFQIGGGELDLAKGRRRYLEFVAAYETGDEGLVRKYLFPE